MIKYRNKEWLEKKYTKEKMSSGEIAELCNVNMQTILKWLEKNNIKRRNMSEATKLSIRKGRGNFKKGHNIGRRFEKGHNFEYTKDGKSPRWNKIKENVSDIAIHKYIKKRKPYPIKCPKCGNPNKRMELSFDHSKGNYTREPNDYIWLCPKCHRSRDRDSEGKINLTNLTYDGIHYHIKKVKPKPNYCTICCKKTKKLQLCCIDHIYTLNPKDYIWLCISCHRIFDQCRAFSPKKLMREANAQS